MLKTARVEKADEKKPKTKWGHLSSFHVPLLSYGP